MINAGRTLVRETPAGPVFPENDRLFFASPRILGQMLSGEITRPYSQHAWVYGCVNAIAQNIMGIPLLFYGGTRKNKQLVESGPLVKLFETPNTMMSGAQLVEAAFIHLGLTGEAFFILERNSERELPKEIWTFPPKRFQEVVDKNNGMIIGWKYNKGSKEVPLAPHEVVYFRYFNPYHDYRGMSPITAGRAGIEQDHYASLYNKAFFRNNAQPGGVLETTANLSDDEFQRLKAQWADRHQGVSKAHAIAVLEGGLSYKQTGLTQKDMDFLEQRKWNRDEIMMVFKVPKGELGIYEDINYATAKTQDRIFWTKTLMPKMAMYEWVLWNQLLSKIPGNQVWAEFDYFAIEALRGDFKEKVENAKGLWGMGVPFNVLNESLDLGLPSITGGDVGYLPFNIAPVGAEVPENPPEKAKVYMPQEVAGILPPPAASNFTNKKFEGEGYWQHYMATHTPLENLFQRKIKRFFYEQRKRQLRRIEELLGRAPASEFLPDILAAFNNLIQQDQNYIETRDMSVEQWLLDQEEENGLLKQVVWPLYLEIGGEAGKMILVELGANPDLFNLPDTPAMAALESKLIQVVGINETVREQLRKTLTEGISQMEATSELMDRVRQVYNFAQTRALTIARTETGQAAGIARDAAMDMLEVVKHRWVTAADEHVRISHQYLNGTVVERGQPFPNGCRFPCDPYGPAKEVINCRCCCAPVVK